MSDEIDYAARALEYLRQFDHVEGEPEDAGMRRSQLEIYGKIISLSSGSSGRELLSHVYPDEAQFPCEPDRSQFKTGPYCCFWGELNPARRMNDPYELGRRIMEMLSERGLPNNLDDMNEGDWEGWPLDEEGAYHGLGFDKEGMNWSILFSFRSDCKIPMRTHDTIKWDN